MLVFKRGFTAVVLLAVACVVLATLTVPAFAATTGSGYLFNEGFPDSVGWQTVSGDPNNLGLSFVTPSPLGSHGAPVYTGSGVLFQDTVATGQYRLMSGPLPMPFGELKYRAFIYDADATNANTVGGLMARCYASDGSLIAAYFVGIKGDTSATRYVSGIYNGSTGLWTWAILSVTFPRATGWHLLSLYLKPYTGASDIGLSVDGSNLGSKTRISSAPATMIYVGSPVASPGSGGTLYYDDMDALGGCEPKWTADTGGAIESSPTIYDGISYVGNDNGRVCAVTSTGVLTEVCNVGAAIKSRIAAYDGNLYFTALDGKAYSYTTAGTQRWATTIGGAALKSTPAVSFGYAYVGSDDGSLYKLDASDGSIVATQAFGSAISSSPSVPPYAGGGLVVVGTDTGTVYGVHATGSAFDVLWSTVVGTSAKGSPVVDQLGGTAYVGYSNVTDPLPAPQGGVTRLNVSNGAFAWAAPTTGEVTTNPWVDTANGKVYAATADGKFCAFNTADGSIVTGYSILGVAGVGAGGTAYNGAPVKIPGAFKNEYLYGASTTGFYSIETGNPAMGVLRYYGGSTSVNFNSTPSVSGTTASDIVVVGRSDGKLYAFGIR